MRRVITLCIIVGLVLASAAPAGAGRVKEEPIQAIECVTPGALDPWFTGKNDKIMHFRDLVNTADEYRFDGTNWVDFGDNTIVVNYNGAWELVQVSPEFGFPVPTVGTYWGTFDLTLTDVGDFQGSWSVGKGTIDGRGSGGSADGALLKVKLLGETPDWAPDPADFSCGTPVTHFVEYTVMSK